MPPLDIPIMWISADTQSKAFSQSRKRVEKLAFELRPKLIFVALDRTETAQAEALGLRADRDADAMIFTPNAEHQYRYNEKVFGSLDLNTVEGLQSFAAAYIDGKLEEYILSQPEPKENNGAVKTIVGSTLNQAMKDKAKESVVVLFYEKCSFNYYSIIVVAFPPSPLLYFPPLLLSSPT